MNKGLILYCWPRLPTERKEAERGLKRSSFAERKRKVTSRGISALSLSFSLCWEVFSSLLLLSWDRIGDPNKDQSPIIISYPERRKRYVSDGVYIVRRAPKRFLGLLPSLYQCTGLISWREKPKESCSLLVRRLDAFPSLPGIVPHRKKERRAPARPVGPLT